MAHHTRFARPRLTPTHPDACLCESCVDEHHREKRRGYAEPAQQLRLPMHPLPHVAGQPETLPPPENGPKARKRERASAGQAGSPSRADARRPAPEGVNERTPS